MQSQGSTSTQPSFDSLSSSDSLLLSDSEQAEDDTDVFLTDSSVITGGAGGAKAKKDVGSESPRSQWDSFMDKEEEEETYRSESDGKHLGHDDSMSHKPKSEGDLLFAQKCAELQGFVRPLLELLNGLKKGRFDHGLSSFQQSVAMDRIQRIVGVLQRPDCGEKYLNTLLQVEAMLKLWFPQISAQSVTSTSSIAISPTHSLQDTSSSTPLHKHKDQSHIPVKKRRLSWTGTDSPAPSPVPIKCPRVCADKRRVTHHHDERDRPSSSPLLATEANLHSPDVVCNNQLNFGSKGNDSESEEPDNPSVYRANRSSEPRLTWVHVAPIPSPRKACLSNEMEGGGENVHASGRRSSPAMQDSSISSTTPPSKLPKPQKKTIQRQNQPVFGQQGGRETTGTYQGQNQSPLFTLKPVPRVSPST